MSTTSPIALITGVSRETGLGLELARQLLAKGFSVIITARSMDKATAAAALLGGPSDRIIPRDVDVTNDDSVKSLAAWVTGHLARLDVLINNAGGMYDQAGTPLTTEIDFARQAFDLNCLAAWRMAKAFVPLLRKSASPRIVNVSSAAASFGGDGYFSIGSSPATPAYAVSKLALNALTVKLAKELAPDHILVNSACPGFTATTPGLEQYGARPVADGAASILWPALIPNSGPTGGFFRDGKPLSW